MMKLSKEDLKELLDIRNKTMELIHELLETGDAGINRTHEIDSRISSEWRTSMDKILGFRPKSNQAGNPIWRADYVLEGDPVAWYREDEDIEVNE